MKNSWLSSCWKMLILAAAHRLPLADLLLWVYLLFLVLMSYRRIRS